MEQKNKRFRLSPCEKAEDFLPARIQHEKESIKMKRKLSLLLAALLVLSMTLVACSNGENEEEDLPPEDGVVLPEDEIEGEEVQEGEDPEAENSADASTEAPGGTETSTGGTNAGNNTNAGGNSNNNSSGSGNGSSAQTPEPQAPAETISGSAQDVLSTLLESSGADFGMTFEDPVTADSAQGNLGLSASDFNSYVEEAYVSTGAVTTNAHLVAIIKCKDAAAATQVKSLVESGFDSGRWICVAPEQSFVVEAGSYVLLAATGNDGAAKLKSAFSTMGGSAAGTVNQFYSGRV